jgi:hypothetical protein
MDQNYAEVHRLLGQSESDRQISTLTQALRDAIPELRNNQLLEKSSNIWSTRNRSWAEHLGKMHKCRKPPFYSHQDVFTINNAHLVTEQDVFIEKQKRKQDNLEQIEVQINHLVHEMRKADSKQRDLESKIESKFLPDPFLCNTRNLRPPPLPPNQPRTSNKPAEKKKRGTSIGLPRNSL